VDDDGNGFVDDVHGWDFVDGEPDIQDDGYHGTHCGAIISATADNGIGITGAYPGIEIMPVKIFGLGRYLSSEEIAQAIRYAADNGARVISASFGSATPNEAIRAAVEHCRDQGVLFVSAAGNYRKNLDSEEGRDYPSCYGIENQLVIGGSDNQDNSATFSNFGQIVDLVAPARWIHSLMPGSKYRAFSGTSQACPLAAGAAALLWSEHPEWTYREVKERLIDSADQRERLQRWCRSSGRLNIYKALAGLPGDRNPLRDFSHWKTMPFELETPHPYPNEKTVVYPVEVPGARAIRIHFERFAIEKTYDTLTIRNGNGQLVEILEGDLGEIDSVVIEGDRATLEHFSGDFINDWGFRIDRIQYEE